MDNISNPNLLNPINNPFLVFTSEPGIVTDLIELREDGSWMVGNDVSHMMTMTEHGLFNCQSPSGFNQVPVSSYTNKGSKIIFVQFANMNPQAYQAMCLIISEKLGKQGYDWLQIVGQAIGLDFLHMPGTEDCSEEGVREIKGIAPFLGQHNCQIIDCIGNQSNPQQVLQFCLNNASVFIPAGIYTG